LVSALSDHLMGLGDGGSNNLGCICFSIRSFGSFDGTSASTILRQRSLSVSVSALSDHLMGHSFITEYMASRSVSVSALSDHLMGPIARNNSRGKIGVSVSALSDHLMGPPNRSRGKAAVICFSIRSFGSFDGTSG